MFISHDLKVVEHFCDRMVVMYLGTVVERISCDNIHDEARHPYTRALLKSNPVNDPADRQDFFILEGEVPSPRNPPAGCPFVTRCEIAEVRCQTDRPVLKPTGEDQHVACWAVTDPEPPSPKAPASQAPA